MPVKKTTATPLDDMQSFVIKHYDNGEFAHIETAEEAKDAGDGLLSFLVVEISRSEDCQGRDEAVSRLDTAIAQLEALRADFLSHES